MNKNQDLILERTALSADCRDGESLFYKLKQKFQESLVLMIMDIKQFQTINYLYGYPAGDEILHRIFAILNNNLRLEETVFRLCEDQYVLLLKQESRYDLIQRILVTTKKSISCIMTDTGCGCCYRLGYMKFIPMIIICLP